MITHSETSTITGREFDDMIERTFTHVWRKNGAIIDVWIYNVWVVR